MPGKAEARCDSYRRYAGSENLSVKLFPGTAPMILWLLSTGCSGGTPASGDARKPPDARAVRTITFQVTGMKKTQSGAT